MFLFKNTMFNISLGIHAPLSLLMNKKDFIDNIGCSIDARLYYKLMYISIVGMRLKSKSAVSELCCGVKIPLNVQDISEYTKEASLLSRLCYAINSRTDSINVFGASIDIGSNIYPISIVSYNDNILKVKDLSDRLKENFSILQTIRPYALISFNIKIFCINLIISLGFRFNLFNIGKDAILDLNRKSLIDFIVRVSTYSKSNGDYLEGVRF